MVVFLPGEQAGMRDFTDAVAGFPTFTHAARRTSQHVDFRRDSRCRRAHLGAAEPATVGVPHQPPPILSWSDVRATGTRRVLRH